MPPADFAVCGEETGPPAPTGKQPQENGHRKEETMEREPTGEPAGTSSREDIMELLILKLSQQGLECGQIARFIKDVLLAIHEYGHRSSILLNQKLDLLGWGAQVLDEFTLQLILFLAEDRQDIRVPSIH